MNISSTSLYSDKTILALENVFSPHSERTQTFLLILGPREIDTLGHTSNHFILSTGSVAVSMVFTSGNLQYASIVSQRQSTTCIYRPKCVLPAANKIADRNTEPTEREDGRVQCRHIESVATPTDSFKEQLFRDVQAVAILFEPLRANTLVNFIYFCATSVAFAAHLSIDDIGFLLHSFHVLLLMF